MLAEVFRRVPKIASRIVGVYKDFHHFGLDDRANPMFYRPYSQAGWPFMSVVTKTAAAPGTLGGHRRARIYGRLDCAAARRAIERGGYVRHRVFFLNEADARAAGYRP